MKFELFQQHPAVEFEPHLDRVARQLRDIGEKVHKSDIKLNQDLNSNFLILAVLD